MLWLIPLLLCLLAASDEPSRDEAVARARKALSEHLEEDLDAVRLVRAEPAHWDDTSLGCPEEGRTYTPAANDGYRVLLHVARRIYAVHVGGDVVVVCPREIRGRQVERVPREARAPSAPVRGEAPDHLVAKVVDDLVKRTGADHSAVEVLRSEAVVWPDGSLGCPRPDQMYTQALVRGYRIVLGVSGKEHDYRVAERGWFVRCEGGRLVDPRGTRPVQ
jgi:hypothetical protein